MMRDNVESQKTIADFGKQWSKYKDNSGYYGSTEMFADIVEPLISVKTFNGLTVLDVGSGTGRIINMLLSVGVSSVTGVEPSKAFDGLKKTFCRDSRVELLNTSGHYIPATDKYDIALSIGVLHHIPNPKPVVDAMMRSLRPGGRVLVWLYGLEGNESYVSIFSKIRKVTTRIPHLLLVWTVWIAYTMFRAYHFLARYFSVPMRNYILNVIGKMAPDKQRLVIYDQLNPCYAKYYTEAEAKRLLTDSGFINVQLFHRHGYSWTVVGQKPIESEMP
ncbi:MAG: class I SAM-dependent methyltransferase [Syntrophales bacterium]